MSDDGQFVYEIARDLGMSSKALRAEIEGWGLGWDVSHHMRRLDPSQCAEVARRLAGTSTEAPSPQSRPRGAAKRVKATAVVSVSAEGLHIPPIDNDSDGPGALEDAEDTEEAEGLDPDDRPVADDDEPSLTATIEAAVAKARRKVQKAEAKARKALFAADQARTRAADFLRRHKPKKAAEAKNEARKFKKKAKKRLAKAKVWAQRALDAAAARLTGGGDKA